MLEWVVLAICASLASLGVYALIKGSSLELEVGQALEYVPKSVSLRVVSIVVRELVRCAGMYVAVAAMLVASMMAAVTTTSSTVHQVVPFGPTPLAGAAICNNVIPCINHEKAWKGAELVVVQLIKWVNLGGRRVMPVLSWCKEGLENRGIDWLTPLCTAARGYVVLHRGLAVRSRSVELDGLGNLSVKYLDLMPITRTYVAPSIPLAPSLGVVGGVTVSVKDPKDLAILPLSARALDALCGLSCSAKCLLLSFDEYPPKRLVSDCVLIEYRNGVALVVSGFKVPTLRSLASLALSTMLAAVVAVVACGGIAEKMRRFCQSLLVQGVSRETLVTSVAMASIATSFLAMPAAFAIPYTLLGGVQGGISLATYTISTALLSYVLSRRVSRSLRVSSAKKVIPASLEVRASKSFNEVVKCVKESLSQDDNFLLSELEVLPLNGKHVLRLELVYRKAMAILVSVEVELEVLSDRLRILYASAEVWSFEEVGEKIQSVASLAIGRAVGTVWLCSEG